MGALLIFSLAGILLGVIPLAQKTLTLLESDQALSAEVKFLGSKAVILDTLDENTLRNIVLVLASAVPPDKSLPTVFTTINTVSGLSDVAITDLTLSNPGSIATASAKKLTSDEAKIGTNILRFSVSGVGSFSQVQTFLRSVVSVRRMFRMQTMNLSISGDEVTFRLDFDAFYVPYPTTVGSTESIAPFTDAQQKTISSVGALPLDSQTQESTISASVPSGKSNPFAP